MAEGLLAKDGSERTAPPRARARPRSAMRTRRALLGYLYLSPWLLGLVIFILGPIIASAYLSLTEYDVLSQPRFVGLENYRTAFFDDELFWPSLWRTLEYSVVMVPIGLFGSLSLALLLNQRVRGANIFRTFYYLPSLTPGVALALIWTWLFHPSTGPVNELLGWFGIEGPGWFQSTRWALPSMIVVSLWASLGGGTTVIFVAGLQGVPPALLDAAQIDGAGPWQRLRHVTLPMISPTLLFNLVLGVIAALKVFTLAFVATKGGPAYATWFFALHIYTQAFEYFKMGYGAALAWVFVVVLLAFTAVQLRLSRRWVYYEGE